MATGTSREATTNKSPDSPHRKIAHGEHAAGPLAMKIQQDLEPTRTLTEKDAHRSSLHYVEVDFMNKSRDTSCTPL